MSDDLEQVLRERMAERAGSAPVPFADDGLADAAIVGAGRIRRRRRVSAAAGGMGLIVLGAAAVVWQPWTDMNQTDDDPVATSTAEIQEELSLEFLVEDDDGYAVVNEEGDRVELSTDLTPESVYRLQDSYLFESRSVFETVALDGSVESLASRTNGDSYVTPNLATDAFAVVTPNEEEETESYELHSVSPSEEPAGQSFTTSMDLTLANWDESVAVFSGWPSDTSGGAEGVHYFNEEHDWGLDTVAEAGFEAAVVVDWDDPDYVCVSDLDPGGSAAGSEQCGDFTGDAMQTAVADAAGDSAANDVVAEASDFFTMEAGAGTEVTDEEVTDDRYWEADHTYFDPWGTWEIAYNDGDDTWLLTEYGKGDGPVFSEFTPPDGAVMPVMSYQ